MPADVQAGGWSSSKNSSAVSVTISAGSVILVERRDLDDVVHVDAVQLDDLAIRLNAYRAWLAVSPGVVMLPSASEATSPAMPIEPALRLARSAGDRQCSRCRLAGVLAIRLPSLRSAIIRYWTSWPRRCNPGAPIAVQAQGLRPAACQPVDVVELLAMRIIPRGSRWNEQMSMTSPMLPPAASRAARACAYAASA